MVIIVRTIEALPCSRYYVIHGQEEPSALLAAKVFLILSEDPSFKARKTTEIVQKPIVDTEAYRLSIPVFPKKVSAAVPNTKSLPCSKRQSPTISPNDMSIDQMEFSRQTYISLSRAGLTNASSIFAKSDEELLKVRNLGVHGVKEIRKWQASRGSVNASSFVGSGVNPISVEASVPVMSRQLSNSKFNETTPATRNHLPKKVHSKAYGSGIIIELISSKGGIKIKILFDNGMEKTFIEKIALQTGAISYEY